MSLFFVVSHVVDYVVLVVQDGRLPIHYAPYCQPSMRLFSVLVNAGMDANTEDAHGHTPQYYMDHITEIRYGNFRFMAHQCQ